jgi:hypothetical protein
LIEEVTPAGEENPGNRATGGRGKPKKEPVSYTGHSTARQAAAGEAESPRPTFLLTIRPEPGIDAIKALRFGLKALLRRYGLRCLAVVEDREAGQ